MIALLVLAIALSMDAFAVAIGLGAKHHKDLARLPIITALYFGVFQGLMPLIGYWGGKSVLGHISHYAPAIACVLLCAIGAKMLYESTQDNSDNDSQTITQRILLVLAIATSIDAMAAGFALNLLPINVWVACGIIALITFAFSYLGVLLGKRSGTVLENKAELLGGVVLILLGLKMLW